MNSSSSVRRGILLLATLLLAWSAAVVITGGIVIETPWRTMSSRAAIRPLLTAGLLFFVYAVCWRHHWSADLGKLAPLATARHVGQAMSILALAIGLTLGTWIAGGPDASGYVSQAAMLARGDLVLPTPAWVTGADWNNAEWSAAPVGYRPAAPEHVLAPVYPPGLPMLMALLMVTGWSAAAFWVVPLSGAAAAWATYRLAGQLGGSVAGAIAAALLASSPPFLDMVTQPMSDVPATAFWAFALLAASRGRPLVAGLTSAVAVLIRPNLVPLAAFPAALLLVEGHGRLARLLWFGAAFAPAAVTIAALNTFYFGSAVRSGYGSLDSLYDSGNLVPNLVRYGGWFLLTQTPLALAGLAAPLVATAAGTPRRRIWLLTCAWPLAVLALYLPYLSFDKWFYLRFLLPGYPGLFAGVGILAVRWGAPARIVTGLIVLYGVAFAIEGGALSNYAEHRRFARAVEYVEALPGEAIVLSNAYSGTLHYYTNCDILRFEVLEASTIDQAVAHARGTGRSVYFIGDGFEVGQFTGRFAGTRTVEEMKRARPIDLNGATVYHLTARN